MNDLYKKNLIRAEVCKLLGALVGLITVVVILFSSILPDLIEVPIWLAFSVGMTIILALQVLSSYFDQKKRPR